MTPSPPSGWDGEDDGTLSYLALCPVALSSVRGIALATWGVEFHALFGLSES